MDKISLNTSFIITTIRAGALSRCLSSLKSYLEDKTDYEVIVVNNGYMQLGDNFMGFEVHETPEKMVGYSYSANYGVARSSAEYENLCFLHDDAIFLPETDIVPMLAMLGTEEDGGSVEIVSPMGLFELGNVSSSYAILKREDNGTASILHRGVGWHKDASAVSQEVLVTAVYSGFIVTRKEAFSKLGGFDEDFAPVFFEDTDLCLSAYEAGMRTMYFPRVKYTHLTKQSMPTEPELVNEVINRHLQLILDKHAKTLDELINKGREGGQNGTR
jgi:GT2 family glycosyltransferase